MSEPLQGHLLAAPAGPSAPQATPIVNVPYQTDCAFINR
jgi:hypothetical protein